MRLAPAVVAGALLLGSAVVVRRWVVRPVQLPAAPTMAPALAPGALAWLLPSAEPQAGDVVLVRPPGEARGMVLRVVANGPAAVALDDGRLSVDGVAAGDRRVGRAGAFAHCVDGEGRHAPVSLRPGEWWGLADRRAGAEDSRLWGAFRDEWVLGVVVGLDGARPPGAWSVARASEVAPLSAESRCPS